MPIVHIHLIEGRTVEQKRRLAAAVTDAVVTSLGVKPDAVRILLHDLAKHDYAAAGVLGCDKTD